MVHANGGDDDFDAIDVVFHSSLDQVIEISDLLRAYLPGDQIGDHVDIGPHGDQECSRLKIFRGGGREGEGAGVFIYPQAHNGCFFRRDGDLSLSYDFYQ